MKIKETSDEQLIHLFVKVESLVSDGKVHKDVEKLIKTLDDAMGTSWYTRLQNKDKTNDQSNYIKYVEILNRNKLSPCKNLIEYKELQETYSIIQTVLDVLKRMT